MKWELIAHGCFSRVPEIRRHDAARLRALHRRVSATEWSEEPCHTDAASSLIGSSVPAECLIVRAWTTSSPMRTALRTDRRDDDMRRAGRHPHAPRREFDTESRSAFPRVVSLMSLHPGRLNECLDGEDKPMPGTVMPSRPGSRRAHVRTQEYAASMVSGIAPPQRALGHGGGRSVLGLDTDLLEGGRDRFDPRVTGPPGALGDSVRSGAAHAARGVG